MQCGSNQMKPGKKRLYKRISRFWRSQKPYLRTMCLANLLQPMPDQSKFINVGSIRTDNDLPPSFQKYFFFMTA